MMYLNFCTEVIKNHYRAVSDLMFYTQYYYEVVMIYTNNLSITVLKYLKMFQSRVWPDVWYPTLHTDANARSPNPTEAPWTGRRYRHQAWTGQATGGLVR